MCFEEEQPAFVFCEVDLDVAVALLAGVDAVVADIAHQASNYVPTDEQRPTSNV